MGSSALGGFVGGLQQGYTFVEGVQTRQAEEARRAKEEERRSHEDQRRDQDQAFQEEERGRKRTSWGKEDQYNADVDALNTSFFPKEYKDTPAPAIGMQTPIAPAPGADVPAAAAPSAPAPTAATPTAAAPPAALPMTQPALGMAQPAVQPPAGEQGAAPAAGLPKQANQLTSMGASIDYLIKRAQIDLQHGKIDGAGVANLYKLRSSAAKEGLNEAVQLLAQGDNDGAMKRFNEAGDMKDWAVESSVDGVFEHGGVKIPTKIVTVKAADGTVRTVNTAQTLVQNQLIDKIVEQAQKGVIMDDNRADAAAGRRIQKQNADTQEQYRLDQAENMREQRRLQEASATAPAAIWGKEDDKFLQGQYSGKDEVSGATTFDGEGMQFAKQVAVARSRFNGGDSATAMAYALAADANLKAQAKGDPVKLRQLRQQALQTLSTAAPRQPQSGGAEWDGRNARSRAGAPDREAGRKEILEQELANEKDPKNIAMIKRELANLGPASAAPASPTPASPTPATKPLFTVGGMSIADRDARMAAYNKAVGGGSFRERFEGAKKAREADVAANFDTQLAAIRPNMPRAEVQKVLTWFNEQADAGTLTNQQLKQVREARQAAHL
jgi:hypothetical protein